MYKVKYRKDKYTIYHSVEEYKQIYWRTEQHPKTDISKLQVDEYQVFQNGHVAPCIEIKKNYRSPKGKIGTLYQFPCFSYFKSKYHTKMLPIMTLNPMFINNETDYETLNKKRLKRLESALNENRKIFINIVRAGHSVDNAIKLLKPSYSHSRLQRYAVKLLNQDVINILLGDNLKSLKQSLLDNGLNNEYIADKIKEAIEDKNAAPQVKKWALEMVMNTINNKEIEIAEYKEVKSLPMKGMMPDVKALDSCQVSLLDNPPLSVS